MDLIVNIVQGVVAVVAVASIICSLTPTPKDDVLIGKLYKFIEALALNVGYAKDSSGDKQKF
jgi:hypothetical protein|tara:strand:+ start:84 stop:269 length:186 start_codon:yes stop_codon:yes gene_type:complete